MKKKKSNIYLASVSSYPFARYASIFLFFFFCSLDLLAQLKVYPTQRKPATTRKNTSIARTKSIEPLSLPFFDDFSFTPVDNLDDTLSNYPLDSIWMNSQSVWISSGLGINAPSINVASFDGLDSLGLPYTNVALASGLCDSLVSRPIKLGKPAVSESERNSVWLSFHYQWCGNGEPPDSNDFIRIMFRNKARKWVQVMQILPKASMDRTVFYDTIIQVKDTVFFHDGFQFKFENRGRKTGPFDTWNIDYVYLNKGRTINSNSFPDRTAASTISPLFKDFYAVPIEHLKPTIELDTPSFDIKNMANSSNITFGYSVLLNVKNYKEGILTEVNDLLIDSASAAVITPGPFERFKQEFDTIPDLFDNSIYHLDSDSIEIHVAAIAQAGDVASFQVNDTVFTKYKLNNYYAYDDGSAEYSAGNTQAGDRFVVAFDMLTPDPDTLTGFYAYFPSFSLISNRQINIHIYKDDNGFPQKLPYYSIPGYTVQLKGINEFQFIKIVEPLIFQGRFYIGYESVSVRIGLDMSHDTGDRMFQNVSTIWYPTTEIHGSVMLRPVFGKSSGEGPISAIPEEKLLSLYPNPSKGQFFIDRSSTLLGAYSITGSSVSFTTEAFGESQQITFTNPTAGLYVLKIQKENKIVTAKVIVH